MKRKKKLLLMSLTALLVIGFGYGIYLVVPQLLAGDTQVADLTLKSQVNDQTIQLTVSDQNQSDTKVVVPLSDNLTYTPTNQTNAGVTYDQVNHQIVIDWLENHAKTANLTVKAEQAGTYVFKAQTTRDEGPVNTLSTSATVKPVESTPTSSVLNSSQATLSEKTAVPGLQESETPSSKSLDTTKTQQKISSRNLPAHADTDIVTAADFDNQPWVFEMLLKGYKLDISKGNVTFGDLKKVDRIYFNIYGNSPADNLDLSKLTGRITPAIQYFPNAVEYALGKYSGELLPAQIEGPIPVEVGTLKSLRTFTILNAPNISGTLPKELGNDKQIYEISISGTKITGEIPAEYGQINALEVFNVSNNHLEGSIPSSLSNITGLVRVYVNGNTQMMGIIPPEIDSKLMKGAVQIGKTQLTVTDPQNAVHINPNQDAFVLGGKQLINYANPTYQVATGQVTMPVIPSYQKIQVFDNLGAMTMNALDLGIGSTTGATADKTPLLSGHTYQISDAAGNIVYDGPADPNFRLAPTTKDTQYIIRMDHTKESLKATDGSVAKLVSTIVLNVKATTPKVAQSFQPEDSNIGTDNNIKYVKQKPFKMISSLQNNDSFDLTVDKMTENIKATDKDKVSVDAASFEMQKPNTTNWESIPSSDVQQTTDGYQVSFKQINLKPTEKVKLRYSVTANESFTDSAVLTHTATLGNTQDLPTLSANMTIKNGQLLFKSVPTTMSFADSKIASMTTEIKRKLPDWKMQIEDTRLNKTNWHITANLISNLKNSNGDSLGDSVVFKKTGQSNQAITTTSAVDVYDGTSGTADYQDVQWGADTGPTLSVAPGLAKLGSYTGTMQWTLIDAPA